MTSAENALMRKDKIAVVDDDDGVRYSLCFLLEIFGHKVEAFASAPEFLAADIAEIGCLILDHHMPHMTGLELAAHLRASKNPIPILLVTGAPSPAIVARAAELGVCNVLEKPPAEQDVLAFINKVMA